jgi:hypothetical protein
VVALAAALPELAAVAVLAAQEIRRLFPQVKAITAAAVLLTAALAVVGVLVQ